MTTSDAISCMNLALIFSGRNGPSSFGTPGTLCISQHCHLHLILSRAMAICVSASSIVGTFLLTSVSPTIFRTMPWAKEEILVGLNCIANYVFKRGGFDLCLSNGE